MLPKPININTERYQIMGFHSLAPKRTRKVILSASYYQGQNQASILTKKKKPSVLPNRDEKKKIKIFRYINLMFVYKTATKKVSVLVEEERNEAKELFDFRSIGDSTATVLISPDTL